MNATITAPAATIDQLLIEAADIAAAIWPTANTLDWAPECVDGEEVLVGLRVIDEGMPVELFAPRAEDLDWTAEKALRAELCEVIDRIDDLGYAFGAPAPGWNRLWL